MNIEVAATSSESISWETGWFFFVSEENKEKFLPTVDNCVEWIKGFCAAMADYDVEPYREYQSIQAALSDQGIKSNLLESCLVAAESIFNSDEWCRFPSDPIREPLHKAC